MAGNDRLASYLKSKNHSAPNGEGVWAEINLFLDYLFILSAKYHWLSKSRQQLPQIPIFPARYPDLRKAIFDQQP
jgi:hypothetical protein